MEADHWSISVGPMLPEMMAHAGAHGFVVLTHDLDFAAVLAVTRGEKLSVVQIRNQDVTVEGLGQTVIAALRLLAGELERGALLTIEKDRTRVRSLPICSSS